MKMYEFLEQFKKHIDQMEQEFEYAVVSSSQMNGMLATYEATVIESYGEIRTSSRARDQDDHYMIFDANANADVRLELENLPSKMKNPFSNMRRWLKFELLDLRAILQAIEKKNEMHKRQQEKIRKRDVDRQELANLREGKGSLKTFFMSKDSIISRITDLTNRILASERDIECLDLIHKIIVL